MFRPCLRFSCGPSHSAEEEESLDRQKKGRRQTMLSPCSLAWLQFISWSFFDSKPLMKLENGDRGREARRTQAMKPPRNDRRCGHVAAYRELGRRPVGRQWGLERACRRIGGNVTAARREMTRRSPTNPAPPIPFPLSPPRCCAPPLVAPRVGGRRAPV